MTNRTVRWLEETDILDVRYSGEITYEYRLGTLQDIENATPSGGLHRLLINYTSAWPAEKQREPGAVAAFGARIATLRFAEGARVALVNAPRELGARTQKASKAAGFAFRSFDERARAIEWLLESSSRDQNTPGRRPRGLAPSRATVQPYPRHEPCMSDDLDNRRPQDRSRINVNEPWEVRWWCKELGCTEPLLREAVGAVSVSISAGRSYLGRR